jgi:cell wall-associated protease
VGCPIASGLGEDYETIEHLRYFRDAVLGKTAEGREIIKLYYQWGPIVSKTMEEDEELKIMVREMIYDILPLIDEAYK